MVMLADTHAGTRDEQIGTRGLGQTVTNILRVVLRDSEKPNLRTSRACERGFLPTTEISTTTRPTNS